ncbi:hypothetical protein [Polaromonas sp. CG9_12]|nr:hypothetical protein [Polaromonas sp. CG9_12]
MPCVLTLETVQHGHSLKLAGLNRLHDSGLSKKGAQAQ